VRLVGHDAAGLAVPQNGDADSAVIARLGLLVGLGEVVEPVDLVVVAVACERPAALVIAPGLRRELGPAAELRLLTLERPGCPYRQLPDYPLSL
jgi:hypothetical protein